MPMFLLWGGMIAASVVAPYILPAPNQPEPPNNGLFRLSLILGIVISVVTLYGYAKGK